MQTDIHKCIFSRNPKRKPSPFLSASLAAASKASGQHLPASTFRISANQTKVVFGGFTIQDGFPVNHTVSFSVIREGECFDHVIFPGFRISGWHFESASYQTGLSLLSRPNSHQAIAGEVMSYCCSDKAK